MMIQPHTRLRRALQLGSLSLVKRIVLANPQQPDLLRNPDLTRRGPGDADQLGNTSLHIAAELGLPDIAAFLIDQGHEADGISRNLQGLTPLMLAAAAGPNEDDPVTRGRVAVGKLIIETFPQFVTIQDKQGMDAFSHAARHGTNAILNALLALPSPEDIVVEDQGATAVRYDFLTSRDNTQNTPLHHASAFGQLKTVRFLVSQGADPSSRNAYSWTPLDYSATVAAEVYLRGLVRDRDRDQTASPTQGRQSPMGRLRGGSDERTRGQRLGIRLVRSEAGSEDGDELDADGFRPRSRART